MNHLPTRSTKETSMTTIAIAQFAPTDDKSANLATVTRLIGDAAAAGADLVVLPEYSMFTVPTMDERFLHSAESLDGPFVSEIATIAADKSVAIVFGMNESIDDPSRISNTLLAIGADGTVVAVYRKIHLYDAFGYKESALVRPGDIDKPAIFEVEGVSFGMQTCYDLRFPEVTRRIVDQGADVLLLPAEWVPGPLKEDHWVTLVRARAIENTIYVAAADQIAPAGAGNSLIVDPMGIVVAALGEEDGVATAEISSDRIKRVRAKNPALALRRFTVTEK